MSTLLIRLTPEIIPQDLIVVYLRVLVEGLVHERSFEADPNLKYKFAWDRRNAYNQKVYGIVTASSKLYKLYLLLLCLVKSLICMQYV